MEKQEVQSMSLADGTGTVPNDVIFVGAITCNNGAEVYVVGGDDGNLWCNSLASPNWTNLGKPTGVIIDINLMAGVIYLGGYAYVFVTGFDKNLWCWTAASGTGTWQNLGGASSFTGASPVGAVSGNDGNAYVYYMGIVSGHYHLWQDKGANTSFQWTDLQAPSQTSIGSPSTVLFSGHGDPYAFVMAQDGNLWYNWLNYNTNQYEWANAGKPSVTINQNWVPVGGLSLRDGEAYTFYIITANSSSHLWCSQWDGGVRNFVWNDLGAPADGSIQPNTPLSYATIKGGDGNAYIFLRDSNGNLQCCFWQDGPGWTWQNLGAPSVGLFNAITKGAAVSGTVRPTVFVVGNDQNIWMASWNGSNWGWSKPFQN